MDVLEMYILIFIIALIIAIAFWFGYNLGREETITKTTKSNDLILISTFNDSLTTTSNGCEDKTELTNTLYRLFPNIVRKARIESEIINERKL